MNNGVYIDNNKNNIESKDLKNRQNKIWAWFFGGVSAVLATTAVFYSMQYDEARVARMTSDDYYRQQSVNTCRRSLYNLADGLQNAEANLGKLTVSATPAYTSKILTETAGIAEGAVADLSYLPMEAKISSCAARYFNQLGDYCKALSKSVTEKGALTEEQKNSLDDLRKVGQKLKKSVDKASASDEAFVWNYSDGKESVDFELELEDVDEQTFDYPQLVYDGPFSDSVTKNTIERQVLSTDQVKQKLAQTFKDYGVGEITFLSKANGKAKVYYYDLTLNGQEYSVATATDGTVAELNKNGYDFDGQNEDQIQTSFAGDIKEKMQNIQNTCCAEAEKMAKALGYEVFSMWTSEPIDGRIYVNMISKQGEVLLYPDMVKMVLDADTLQVVGVDAFGYLANHKARELPKVYLNRQEAKAKLSQNLSAEELKLCIVPDNSAEVLCYEAKANLDGEEFLIYIDAITGEEVEILKIINDKMGYTVL